jgi:hypothetical protein
MSQKTKKRLLGRRQLHRIIDFCKSVEKRGLDPFTVNINDVIAIIKEYYSEWNHPRDLCLDSETVHQISSIIKLQSDWVRNRSTTLYTDPFLLDEKIRRIKAEELIEIFLNVWNPIIELEQLSPHSLLVVLEYWKDLLPIEQRWQKNTSLKQEIGVVTRDELIRQRILAEQTFSNELEGFWKELRQKAGREEKIRYWDFIGADTYSKTVERAYLVAFLVTYGYAALEKKHLEEELVIKPFSKLKSFSERRRVTSFPVSIDIEDWRKWKKGIKL